MVRLKMRRNYKDIGIDALIIVVISIVLILCVLPMVYVLALSLSSKSAIVSGRVGLFPVGFTMEAYLAIMKTGSVMYSLGYTAILTLVYTALCMFMTICAAYPLTKDNLKGKNFFLLFILFTMYFGGGIIPEYILFKKLQITNTPLVLILPGLISTFNLIILKSFFLSLPSSLEESATIDGCSDIGILFKVVLPLSTPVLATLSLFYAVGRWNGFQDALIFITKPKLYPIQLKLYQMIIAATDSEVMKEGVNNNRNLVSESVRSACIIFATVPILLLYPKLQKYFISGVMIGAVKG